MIEEINRVFVKIQAQEGGQARFRVICITKIGSFTATSFVVNCKNGARRREIADATMSIFSALTRCPVEVRIQTIRGTAHVPTREVYQFNCGSLPTWVSNRWTEVFSRS